MGPSSIGRTRPSDSWKAAAREPFIIGLGLFSARPISNRAGYCTLPVESAAGVGAMEPGNSSGRNTEWTLDSISEIDTVCHCIGRRAAQGKLTGTLETLLPVARGPEGLESC